jgi:NADH:ubiquinone oxidoreductase subunit C
MDTEQNLVTAETLLQPFTVGAASRAPGRLDAVIGRDDLTAAVRVLVAARWGYLAAITGLDHPWPKTPMVAPKPGDDAPPAGPTEDRLEALYHFVNGAAVATLRVSVPYHDARLPTICPIIPSATLYERELQEMFGILVEGTPDPARLLLPDDWPDGVYPLRKAFRGFGAQADRAGTNQGGGR